MDIGYAEGVTLFGNLLPFTGQGGLERVFDLYDFEYGEFAFLGAGAYLVQPFVSAGGVLYMGMLTGWQNDHELGKPGISNYQGITWSISGAFKLPVPGLIGQLQYFGSLDGRLMGVSGGIGVGFDPIIHDSVHSQKWISLRSKGIILHLGD
jgi:hypothetical protein